MARGQDNGITILLGVKDVKVGEVTEYEDRIVVKASMEKKEKNAHTVDQKSSISMEKAEQASSPQLE